MRSEQENWLQMPQPRLGTGGLVMMLAAANIICPLSLDMYTPAVPLLPSQFGASASTVNLTISGFYLFYSLGMLLFGPICDRLGRKPVLVSGLVSFSAGSMLCALAWSIETLILFRLIEAIGAGAVCAVSTAIVKDCFTPEKRTTLLSIIQVLMVIGPVAAPLLGGFIIAFSTWHITFVALAAIGVICVALSLLYCESLPEQDRSTGSMAKTFLRIGYVAKNRGFTAFLIIASLFSVPFMAYVSAASYVYTQHFGVTPQQYTYFFAATAAMSVLGPIAYLRANRAGMTPRTFTHIVIAFCLIISLVLLTAGQSSIAIFFACFAVFAPLEASIRPYTTNILLAQSDRDAGSTSSLINFSVNIFGVAGMGLISLWNVQDYALGLGVLLLGSSIVAIPLWLYVLTSKKAHVKGL